MARQSPDRPIAESQISATPPQPLHAFAAVAGLVKLLVAELVERVDDDAAHIAVISRLLSTTVHDVNNALQVISGSAEMLQMAPGPADAVARRSATVGTQARRASGLLTDLMAFARDASDQTGRINLRSIAERAVALRQYSLSKLRVNAAVDGDDVEVHASRNQLLQIVLNLLLNAEAALAGRPDPKLRLTIARGGDRATITVEDNGSGISAAKRDGLFDTVVPGPANLGIGLAVSHALAEKQKGTLRYAPVPGGGSAFTLTLPRAD